jgi:predicted amidohydrolase
MTVDLLIRNGTVIDPARKLHAAGDVAIAGGRIVAAEGAAGAHTEIDATGCLVVPGLIDNDAHVWAGATAVGVRADASCLPQGVTTVVDAGSAGPCTYRSFAATVPPFNDMRVFSLVNVSDTGIISHQYPENVDPQFYDADALARLFALYPGQLIGLKVRVGKEMVGDLGLKPLVAALEIAGRIGCQLVVHVTNPPCTMDRITDLLRPGDVFVHCYQGLGPTIIGDDGHVLPGVRAARARGVIFDACNGRRNFSFPVAKAAIADGFPPDIISTDLTTLTSYGTHAFGLPYLMSKYLDLDLGLDQVIAACTATPARQIGKAGVLGTLAPGALGDVTVLERVNRRVRYLDFKGEAFIGNTLLVTQLTVLEGRVLYRQIDFAPD